jgi:hypothetical protein
VSLTLTSGLLIGATVLGGLLAGSNFDRALLAMPAWRRLGPTAWTDFSRHADLGNGLILYPVEAIGAALLTIAAAISIHFDDAPALATWILNVAVVLAIGGLLLTVKAAPIMLGIRETTDPDKLRRAFDGFHYWGNLRAICQVLAFPALVLALAALRGLP